MAVNRDVQTTPTAQQAAERRLGIVGRASLGAAVMLVVQYGLGIGVNLYIAVPTGGSAGSTAGRAFSNGPLLAAHAVLGVLLVLTAVSLVVRAVLARQRAIIVLASLGLLAILAAAGNGVGFPAQRRGRRVPGHGHRHRGGAALLHRHPVRGGFPRPAGVRLTPIGTGG